jgi:hypothetical protein
MAMLPLFLHGANPMRDCPRIPRSGTLLNCIKKHGVAGLTTTINTTKLFFNGLDEDKAKHYENMMTASPALHTVLENDAYSALPCVYLLTGNDFGLPVSAQEWMVTLQNMRDEVNIKVVRCQSGHAPFLTWT